MSTTRAPDVLRLYRGAAPLRHRWTRRTADGRIVARSGRGFRHKVAMWRNLCRENPDYERCRIDDRTFAWRKGGTNLSRPPLQEHERTPRELPTIREAQRRL